MSAHGIPEPTWKAGPLDGHTPDFGELLDEARACFDIAGRAELRSTRRAMVGHVMELMQRALDLEEM